MRTDDESIFPDDANIISEYNDMYLLGFESEDDAKQAYAYCRKAADFAEVDIALLVSDDNRTENASSKNKDDALSILSSLPESEKGSEKPHYKLAIIDTGAMDNDTVESVSVIDKNLRMVTVTAQACFLLSRKFRPICGCYLLRFLTATRSAAFLLCMLL